MFNIEKRLEQAKAEKSLIQNQIKTKSDTVDKLKIRVENLIKARYILGEVARLTQENFQAKVEGLITMAIASVFDRDFKFKLHLERKRNKLECRPVIVENEHEYSPEDDMGGGIVDVISLAWRVVLWTMEKPRSRNVIILDEPAGNMGDLTSLFGRMLTEVSKKLEIQFIVITHDQELMEFGDTSYLFTYKDGITDAKKIKVELSGWREDPKESQEVKEFKKLQTTLDENSNNYFPNLPKKRVIKRRRLK